MPEQETVKPHIIIGSSSQAKVVAEAIQYSLRDVAQGQPWTQNVFEQTEPFLTSLLNEAEKADFAILVMTPDDFVEVRDRLFEHLLASLEIVPLATAHQPGIDTGA